MSSAPPLSSPLHFTLYSRSWCHLCEDMLLAFRQFMAGHPHELQVLDVDEDPELTRLYDELVPVLVGKMGDQAPVQICHYFLDRPALEAFLAQPEHRD